MTQASPKLRVSSQVLNTHSAVKHTAAKNKTEGASAAKNASAPHTRGGRKKKGVVHSQCQHWPFPLDQQRHRQMLEGILFSHIKRMQLL